MSEQQTQTDDPVDETVDWPTIGKIVTFLVANIIFPAYAAGKSYGKKGVHATAMVVVMGALSLYSAAAWVRKNGAPVAKETTEKTKQTLTTIGWVLVGVVFTIVISILCWAAFETVRTALLGDDVAEEQERLGAEDPDEPGPEPDLDGDGAAEVAADGGDDEQST